MLELAPACERSAWLARIRGIQKEHEPHQAYRRRPDTPTLMPHDVFASLDRAFLKRTGYRVVTDVGQHQMWAAQLIEWGRPRSHITSGGAGTMGFAIPAALGAALAHPNETIWVIVGDGGFQMTNQEIATMVQEDVRNVKIAVINNGYLGMVRQWQELFEGARYSGTKLSGPDIAMLVERVWRTWRIGRATAGCGCCDRERVGARWSSGDRFPRGARGKRVSDRACGKEHQRDDGHGYGDRMKKAGVYSRSHTIVALLQDRPGVLHRAVSLLRRRGYNIASLAVGSSEMEGVSRMTLVVEQDDVEQVVKQLNRLVEVLQVDDVTYDPTIEREAVLVKVAAGGNMQSIVSVALGYGATIADVGMGTMLLELSGSPAKVEGFLQRLSPFGILEATRTGRIAMVRGRAAHSAAGLMADFVATAVPQSPEQWLSQADGINGTN